MAKKKSEIKISFQDSMSADDVTGSMVLVETPTKKILLDSGSHQTNDRVEDFLINNRRLKGFKPKDIDCLFLSHNHCDHTGYAPRLYKMGFTGRTIIPSGANDVLRDMLLDSAQINERDVLIVNAQKGKEYDPLYTEADVFKMLDNTIEYPINEKIKIDDELSFKFVPSGHLLNSVQVLLYITYNNVTKTILYTGDIGNKTVDNKFVGKYQQVENADLCIMESTYGERKDLKTTNKERKTDLDKLKTIIDKQVREMKGKVIIPSFANGRVEQLCYMICKLYEAEEWKPKVYVDSPLAIKIFEDYKKSVNEDDLKLLEEIENSGMVHFIKSPEDSMANVDSQEPSVVLSTAGFANVGRIRHYLKKHIPDSNSTVLFVGYSSPGSLSSVLKDPKTKEVTIDQKSYPARISVYNLTSMSGHAPFKELVDDGASVNCQKIVLHHGSPEAKETLKKALEKELEKRCKTTRVVIANSSLKFSL